MAVLRSEDQDNNTSLTIRKGESVMIQDQLWQRFELHLATGSYQLRLGGDSASSEEKEACLLCQKPKNEIFSLMEKLRQFIDSRSDKLLFEPAEPSFELTITRSAPSGAKVEIWLDSGNAKTGFYTWDGAGIRFFTVQEHLVSFLNQLEEEFAC